MTIKSVVASVSSGVSSSGFNEAAFTELLKVIEDRRTDFNKITHVPREVVDMMKAAGIYRAAAPECFGGTGVPPHLFLKRIEMIAEVDGSASWVAGFGSANTYYAALPYETQKFIYANGPDQVFAGGLYPVALAKRLEGGWKVSGRWRFASGCMGADWIAVGITDTGDNQVRMAVRPAADIKIIPNWNMIGMQGTGSYDTELTNCFIPDDWTCLRGSQPIFDDPLYRYPLLAYQAQVHAASSLGLARAAIGVATEMAMGKKLMPGAAKLADRAYFCTGLAKAEAMLQSCRLYYYDAAEHAWDMIIKGDELSIANHNALRLSATYAAHTAAKVIEVLYRISGMAAAAESNRLQQLLRDVLVVTQHASLSEATLELAGGVLAGAKPGVGFL